MSINLALFASGTGSNALNLLETARTLKRVKFKLLVVDQPASPLPARVRTDFPDLNVLVCPFPAGSDLSQKRLAHEALILNELRAHEVDWIFLAGYMRIIGPTLLLPYTQSGKSRIINIHPSLLPAYPGLNAYENAFRANEKQSGVTIHRVDSGVDTGPILVQQSFERLNADTLAHFIESCTFFDQESR